MTWINYHKPLTTNSNLSLHDALQGSYGTNTNNITKKGYVKDNQLSNHNQTVYYRPNDKKLLYLVAGTHNLTDWGTDAYLAVGKLKDTNRYKEADNVLTKAKTKYQPKETVLAGHSLGSTIINQIASKGNNDKVYSLNGGFTFGQKVSNNKNFHNYRTKGDLVSALSAELPSMKTIVNKDFIHDPISSHDIKHIKDEQIFI